MSAAAWMTAAASGVLMLGLAVRMLRGVRRRHTEPVVAPDREWLEVLRQGKNSRATRRLARTIDERGWMLSGPPRRKRSRGSIRWMK